MQVEPAGFSSPTLKVEGRERLPPEAQARVREIAPRHRPFPSDENTEEQRPVVDQAVERLNRMADIFATSLRFSIHEATHTIMVRVVDTRTGEVIREIPPEQILNAVAKMQEMLGLLFDEKA